METYSLKHFLILTTINIFILSATSKSVRAPRQTLVENTCDSITIHSVNDFDKLQNCTVIIGHLRIVDMYLTPTDLEGLEPTKIEEITEYLLVYRVNGLDSLERLFPNLILIRGVQLLYDTYAMAILENRHMVNVGLVSLLRVLKGSIRIESNPLLCYAHTINWQEILHNDTSKYYIHIYKNKHFNFCPACSVKDKNSPYRSYVRGCWSHKIFQKHYLDFIDGRQCFQSSCLTGCEDKLCRHCVSYMSDEGCMRTCLPPKYKLAYQRKCVTNCTEYGLAQLGMECVNKCPKHYQAVNKNGTITCVLNCTGNIVIHNVKDLEGLADCSTINGSLTIELHEKEKPIVQHLEDAFQNLNEVTGYLMILNSPQIISLHFFKNLHSIRGEELVEKRYSLYVMDNNYLQELFLGNVAFIDGCIFFHLNPILCYDKIVALKKGFKKCEGITTVDVSNYSNGERAVCGSDILTLNATVLDVNSNSALIEVDYLNSNELLILVGHAYYYKEAPFKNVTKFDGRHGCGKDGWFTDTVLTRKNRHIIKKLKPATQYVFFVNTLTATDFPYAAEHISELRYFTTLPAKPEAVEKMYANAMDPYELDIHWWPPVVTNGVIEKYILQYNKTDAEAPKEEHKLYEPKPDDCECHKLHTESHVPTPHAKQYYSPEQLVYRNSILNFVVRKREDFNTTKTKRNASDTTSEDNSDDGGWGWVNKILNNRARIEQEEGKESYIIPHPDPICDFDQTSNEMQVERNCVPLERFENAIVISGKRFKFTLCNLEPGATYRISLRACVEGLVNGCGPEKVVLKQTLGEVVINIINKPRRTC